MPSMPSRTMAKTPVNFSRICCSIRRVCQVIQPRLNKPWGKEMVRPGPARNENMACDNTRADRRGQAISDPFKRRESIACESDVGRRGQFRVARKQLDRADQCRSANDRSPLMPKDTYPIGCGLIFYGSDNRERHSHQTKKSRAPLRDPAFSVAEWTGLEPATPGVTGRYSNQLNYHSATNMVGAEGIEPPTLAL